MNYVPIEEAIALAKSTCQMTQAEERLAEGWAVLALPFLGISDDEIEVCVIKPKNGVAKKPDNMRVLIDLSLFSEDVSTVKPTADNQLPHLFRTGAKRIYQKKYPVITEELQEEIDVSEDRHHIILGTNGSKVKSIMVRYFAYPVDDRGRPLLRQEDLLAVSFFIRWHWAIKNEKAQSVINSYWEFWARYADMAKARSKMLHHEQVKAIMRKVTSMIPTFNRQDF